MDNRICEKILTDVSEAKGILSLKLCPHEILEFEQRLYQDLISLEHAKFNTQ